MGGKNSKAQKLQYDAKEWQQVEKSDLYEVLRNKSTGVEGNRYHFHIKSDRKLKEEVDIYHRRSSPSNWVQVLGAKVEKSGFGFCGSEDSANVITERIPLTLHQVSRLNRDESNIVLYNALRGFNDTSKIVVPTKITDKMIGFTPAGQTKVWVNENFGMNYPVHYDATTELNEAEVVNNLVNAVSPKADLTTDYVNALRSSGNFNNALNFIRTNSGVPTNVLESNRIDVSRHWGKQNVGILNTVAPVNNNHIVVSQPIYNDNYVQNTSTVNTNYQYNQPPTGYTTTTSHVHPRVNWTHNTVGTTNNSYVAEQTYQRPGDYQIPNRYTEVSNANKNTKFSFTHNN